MGFISPETELGHQVRGAHAYDEVAEVLEHYRSGDRDALEGALAKLDHRVGRQPIRAEVAERHSCFTCKAEPGQPCRTHSGGIARSYHTYRNPGEQHVRTLKHWFDK